MNRFQRLLGLFLLTLVCFNSAQARNNSGSDSDSDSDSNSQSDESGGYDKVTNHAKSSLPRVAQSYGYPYNHPVYMASGPPTPYGGYNPPPKTHHYGHGQVPLPGAPSQAGYGIYPYGVYHNQIPAGIPHASQHSPELAGGASTINNKVYKEDGQHDKPDSYSTE